MVDLASLQLVDPIDRRDELTVVASPTILFALYLLIAVFSLICGFSLGLALVFVEDCIDGLLVGGVACREVEQLPHRPRFAAPELVNECFVGRARDECSNHVCVYDVRNPIALLGEAADVLT